MDAAKLRCGRIPRARVWSKGVTVGRPDSLARDAQRGVRSSEVEEKAGPVEIGAGATETENGRDSGWRSGLDYAQVYFG